MRFLRLLAILVIAIPWSSDLPGNFPMWFLLQTAIIFRWCWCTVALLNGYKNTKQSTNPIFWNLGAIVLIEDLLFLLKLVLKIKVQVLRIGIDIVGLLTICWRTSGLQDSWGIYQRDLLLCQRSHFCCSHQTWRIIIKINTDTKMHCVIIRTI